MPVVCPICVAVPAVRHLQRARIGLRRVLQVLERRIASRRQALRRRLVLLAVLLVLILCDLGLVEHDAFALAVAVARLPFALAARPRTAAAATAAAVLLISAISWVVVARIVRQLVRIILLQLLR